MVAVAIICALLGAVSLAVGSFLQGSTINETHGDAGVSIAGIFSMFKQPRWVAGLVFMGLGMLLNLTALRYAPLMIVQPLGSLAVVITTLINTKAIGGRLNQKAMMGILACVFGSVAFVIGAMHITNEQTITREQEEFTMRIMLVVFCIVAFMMTFLKKWAPPFSYVLSAGILFGFVSVLTRITLTQFFDSNGKGWANVNFIALAALVICSLFGSWVVQNAYSKQPPDMVSAGLTVIDPIVGVSIGIVLLGEAKSPVNIPISLGMVVAAGIAISGVVTLSKFHPGREVAASKAQQAQIHNV
ncbi:MAG: DMT family transporter [Micrococcaceae bacterium]